MPAKAKISGSVVAGFPSPDEQREEPCAAMSQGRAVQIRRDRNYIG